MLSSVGAARRRRSPSGPMTRLVDTSFPDRSAPAGRVARTAGRDRGQRERASPPRHRRPRGRPAASSRRRATWPTATGRPTGPRWRATRRRRRQAARFLRILASVIATTGTSRPSRHPYGEPAPARRCSTSSSRHRSRHSGSAGQRRHRDPRARRRLTTVASPAGGQLTRRRSTGWPRRRHDVVLADADTIDRVAAQGSLAPAPTVPTDTSGPTLVLPDPDTQALFARIDLYGDPVRAAQIVLGELARDLEAGAGARRPDPVRGIAVAPPPTLPPAMWAPLLGRIAGRTVPEPVTATASRRGGRSRRQPEHGRHSPRPQAAFDPDYAARIQRLRSTSQAYGSMLGPATTARSWRRAVRRDRARRTWATRSPDGRGSPSVDTTTQQAFDAVTPTVSPKFTFTSREGTIPIAMGDPGDTSVRRPGRADVAETSPSRTAESERRPSTGPDEIVVFQVIANASGTEPDPGPVDRAPNGTPLTEPDRGRVTTITVRSTAVNRIALFVTIGRGPRSPRALREEVVPAADEPDLSAPRARPAGNRRPQRGRDVDRHAAVACHRRRSRQRSRSRRSGRPTSSRTRTRSRTPRPTSSTSWSSAGS